MPGLLLAGASAGERSMDIAACETSHVIVRGVEVADVTFRNGEWRSVGLGLVVIIADQQLRRGRAVVSQFEICPS